MTSKFQVAEGLKNIPLFYEFGKFAIHRKKLDDNILLVKYKKSRGPVRKFEAQRKISDPFATLLLDVIDTGTINYELVKDLDQSDKDTFEDLLKRADLVRVLKYQRSKALITDDDLKTRFEVLQGEIMAGNDNIEIIREAKEMIKLLVSKGMMEKKEANEIISELLS